MVSNGWHTYVIGNGRSRAIVVNARSAGFSKASLKGLAVQWQGRILYWELVVMFRIIVLACFCLVIMACASLPREPVPVDRVFDAKIAGMPNVRAWGGIMSQDFQSDLVESHRQESPGQFPLDEHGLPIYDALALSGGGASGAYGAGYLNGWTTTGSRPDFKLVTGISTGALTAPMAFLGPEYDAQLKAVFTSVETDNILKVFNPIRIIYRNESIASTGPLEELIDANYDEDFIRKVAARHNQGYRLYIGTHHMDAQRLVVWNMGLIANSGHPDAVKLFRKVVLASASIPIAFPPVMIESEVDGESYDEMHVDGGISVQVFFYAGTVDVTAAISDAASEELKEHPANKGGSLCYS